MVAPGGKGLVGRDSLATAAKVVIFQVSFLLNSWRKRGFFVMNSRKTGSCLFAISECDGGLLVLCTVILEEVYVNVFDGDLIPLSYKNLRCFFFATRSGVSLES